MPTMNRSADAALASAGGYVPRDPLINRTVPNEDAMYRYAGIVEVREEIGQSITELSQLNGGEGLDGLLRSCGDQGAPEGVESGGLSQTMGPSPGGVGSGAVESGGLSQTVGPSPGGGWFECCGVRWSFADHGTPGRMENATAIDR